MKETIVNQFPGKPKQVFTVNVSKSFLWLLSSDFCCRRKKGSPKRLLSLPLWKKAFFSGPDFLKASSKVETISSVCYYTGH